MAQTTPTTVINFFAGPSAGKSTMAAQLFGWMKAARMNVEYAPEYAKDLVWKNNLSSLDDQYYVLGKQHHRIYTLLGQVDYVITDCPLLLSLHYSEYGFKKFDDEMRALLRRGVDSVALALHAAYNNINFYVERGDRQYINAGRLQTEDQAKEIDSSVEFLLNQYNVPFTRVSSIDAVISKIQEDYVARTTA